MAWPTHTWLLLQPLQWMPVEGGPGTFMTSKYPKEFVLLRMNDFPDEPLWTLIIDGQELDIEDTPVFWRVQYGSV